MSTRDAPAPLTSVTESSDQQSVCSLSLPDLNLMDFFNGCSPTSIQPYVDALNEPINYNMDQDFAQNLTPCLTTWASDDAIMDPFPKEGQADSLSLSSGTAAHSTKAVQHEVPQHEAPQLNFGMEGSCVCAPSCHAGLAWVSLWCTRQLDDNTRSKLENVEALKVPPLEVMHALIEQYFLFANGQVPCVNEYDTYRLLRGNFPQSNQHLAPMSLALLNAILFAASGFSTVAQAEASGFLDICNMRTGFYRRAKALYDAGCETRSMDRLRICLLLSTYRSCTTINNEASSWLVEAQKILLKVDIRPLMTQSRLNADEKQWKLLYGCYILRTCTLITGSRCGGSSLDLPTMGPRLRLEDLLDLECTWLLDSATKRKVADLFLAIQSLSLIAMPFSQLLKRHSADVLLSTFEMHESEKSLITELQDLESLLAEWLSEHKSVLLEHPWPAAPTRKDICLFAVQSSVKLSYE
ncbi:hypothetical protein H2204_000364 [Knufia peltigerae]|uniref:Xylanolytic transcriptional activator regulatory domain-containing protein n=1 Tax=Knufia peltigerae TaxID=1002370 RepID=A0AA38YF23_9EURO|nr:hypothetical protein H2204_000364 [Knufia peltigerae]